MVETKLVLILRDATNFRGKRPTLGIRFTTILAMTPAGAVVARMPVLQDVVICTSTPGVSRCDFVLRAGGARMPAVLTWSQCVTSLYPALASEDEEAAAARELRFHGGAMACEAAA